MLDSLIKATILLMLVAGACQLLRRQSASLRHMLWTMAMVGLIAIPLVTTFAPASLRWRVLPVLNAPAPGLRESATRPQPSSQLATPRPDSKRTGPEIATAAADARATDTDGQPVAPRLSWRGTLLLLWAFGAALLLTRFLAALVAVRRIARRATEITDERWHAAADRAARSLGVVTVPELRQSDDVAMPFACGLVRPIIVIPSAAVDWTAEHRDAVLMHELAHVSRGDLTMNAVSHLVRAVYWFHPLAWLAAYRLRVEGERACDDAVLRAGALPSNYAEHLLNIVRSVGRSVPSVALAMARKSDFEGRLLAILEPGMSRSRLSRPRTAAIAAAFLVFVTPLAAMAPAPAASPAAFDAATAPELAPRTAAPLAARVPQQPAADTTIRTVDSTRANRVVQSTAQAPTSAVAALIETLGDANANVRVAAVQSLSRLQDPRAIAALSRALREDTDARVREAAANALGEIDDARAVPALLDALKTERVAAVREKIVHALGEIDDPSAVAGITAVTKDPSVKVRREVAWALGELEDQSAVPALIGMARDEDSDVRRHVAEALGELKNTAAIDALTVMVKDADAEVRREAVSALGNLEDRRALGAILGALKDANAEVRRQAADAVDELEDIKQAPAALIEALSDPDREVRREAANSLGSIEDPAAVPALKRLTADTDTEVRHAAAEALSEIGGPEAIQALLGLLKDPDPEIRRIAAEALGSKKH